MAKFVPVIVALLLVPCPAKADEVEESLRVTPLVRVIRRLEPAAVALYSPLGNQLVSGSGSVIHENGFVLTNSHVIPRTEGLALIGDSKPIPFRLIGRIPESDIAVVKLDAGQQKLDFVQMGKSHDVMNGESVVVAGNPGGRGIVFTSGIVSSRSVLEGGPNALVMTNYENSRRDTFIQFDAASNRGNSGGALINMDGRLIGVVAAGVQNEQNVGFAIPIDRIRSQMKNLVEPELIHRRFIGVEVASDTAGAVVVSVHPDSPAQTQLTEKDVIVALNGHVVRNEVDWVLILDDVLARSQPLKIEYVRSGELRVTEVMPDERSDFEPVVSTELVSGLSYSFYHGRFDALPDFESLQPERTGLVSGLGARLSDVYGSREEYFAVVLTGFLSIPADGLFRIVLVSDDGSRLTLHNQLLIDHDGNHPPKPAGRLVRLRKGLHPVRIEYFQGNGDKSLNLFVQPCGSREQVPAQLTDGLTEAILFTEKPAAASE